MVKWEIAESVRKWRWRNLGNRHASFGIARKGHTPNLRPTWKRSESGGWGSAQRGGHLCFRAGFAVEHPKCLFCVHDLGGAEEASVGTLRHRHYRCSRTKALRDVGAPEAMVVRPAEEERLGILGEDFALDRGSLQPLMLWYRSQSRRRPSVERMHRWMATFLARCIPSRLAARWAVDVA